MTEGFNNTLVIRQLSCPDDCQACMEACTNIKGLSSIKPVHLPELGFHSVIVCTQCRQPNCVEICPTGAISKNEIDGIVNIDPDTCVGCGLCTLACPYAGMHFDYTQEKAFKCDHCEREPRCAAACPYRVLSFARSRSLYERLNEEDLLAPGVGLCTGCLVELAERITLKVLGSNSILFVTPGCAVGSLAGIGNAAQTRVSVYACLMTNIASSMTGMKRYFRKIGRDVTCACFVGDGATADIGFQVLSGAAERGENILYICYDNEAYMNTGIQRSSTTPWKSWTTTTSVGEQSRGKSQEAKNLPLIMLMHSASYVATASVGYLEDYIIKLEKAIEATKHGLAYVHLLTPCPTGWRTPTNIGIKLGRLAVETNYFPLWEADNGKMRFNYEVKKPRPIKEFTSLMARFSHLSEEELEEFQQQVNGRFNRVKALAHAFSPLQ